MIALIKSFSIQHVSLTDGFRQDTLVKSFSLQHVSLTDGFRQDTLAKSFSVQTVKLTESMGGERIVGSFSLAKGGYAISDSVTLENELDDSKVIRQK